MVSGSNPPPQKEYVECCKSTGKKYNSVKEMVDHLSNIKYNL